MDIKTVFEITTPEQRTNALKCKTAEELGKFSKNENVSLSDKDVLELFAAMHKNTGEISDDDLDNVAGGKSSGGCPQCGSTDYEYSSETRLAYYYTCNKCGETWGVDHG